MSRTIRQVEVMSLDGSHCLRTCFWYSSGSTRLLFKMPAAAFQLLGIRGRGCQTPCPFRISTGVVVPIDFSFPQTANACAHALPRATLALEPDGWLASSGCDRASVPSFYDPLQQMGALSKNAVFFMDAPSTEGDENRGTDHSVPKGAKHGD